MLDPFDTGLCLHQESNTGWSVGHTRKTLLLIVDHQIAWPIAANRHRDWEVLK